MTFKTILLYSALTIFSSSNGLCDSTVAIGDTVKELGDSLWVVFQDSKNNYWFGSNGEGVYRYDGKNILRFTTKNGLTSDSIRQIQEDKSGNLYFATLGGICKFDGQAFSTLSPIESNASAQAWKSESDDLWFPGNQEENGPYRYDGKSLYHLQFPKSDLEDEFYAGKPAKTFSPYQAYCAYKDSKGNIWFGTSNFGVCRYDGKSFSWITENGLAESPVRSIVEDKKGNFWFGNSGQGLYRYDGKTMTNYRKEKGIGNLKSMGEDFPVSYNSITEDNNGDLWIATYRSGVWQYDGEGVTHYPVTDGDGDITLFSIYKDNQGDLWLGTCEDGAYKFNGKTFEKFRK